MIDIVISTTDEFPPAVTAVWSPQDRTLIVSAGATREQAEQAWAAVSDRPWPGLPEHRSA